MTHGSAIWQQPPAVEAHLRRVPLDRCVSCGRDERVVRRVCMPCRQALLAKMYPRWLPEAACRDRDPAYWYAEPYSTNKTNPLSSHSVRVAKSICSTCPVRKECLEAGMSESGGIWGGALVEERREGTVEQILEAMDKQAKDMGLKG